MKPNPQDYKTIIESFRKKFIVSDKDDVYHVKDSPFGIEQFLLMALKEQKGEIEQGKGKCSMCKKKLHEHNYLPYPEDSCSQSKREK